jgi:phosphate transport system protein
MTDHSSKQYDAELESLRSQVLELGGLVEKQISLAFEGLAANDMGLVAEVIRREQDVNRMEMEIDALCCHILGMTKMILESARAFMPTVDLKTMADDTIEMLRRVLDSYARSDASEATDVIRRDIVVDDEFRAILRQLITYMMEDPRTISRSIEILFIAKALERIGDHSKNMCEHVVYMIHGRDVRHPDIPRDES